MEKYLNLAKVKRREFSLKGCNESFSKGVKSGVIKVMGKEDMVRLAIKPDGNCQFRAVATLLSGADDNDNHKVLRKLACEEFKNETVESLRRTGFFSHSESDCLTENVVFEDGELGQVGQGVHHLRLGLGERQRVVQGDSWYTEETRDN